MNNNKISLNFKVWLNKAKIAEQKEYPKWNTTYQKAQK